ncbi:formylglycine-generating enzyme family protein [Candidatus Poribacteria bacterium]|nr:formylglycine-generating enzyme family protein [Candidatus Poribacteria bacterium]
MKKREEFIDTINLLRSTSNTISVEQRTGILKQGVQEYGLSIKEADIIIRETGLRVADTINYFRALGLSNHEFENLNENTITSIIEDAHRQHYTDSLKAGGLPRTDGRTQKQWRIILNYARDTLIDPQKREKYLSQLLSEEYTSDNFNEDLLNIHSTDIENGNQKLDARISLNNQTPLLQSPQIDSNQKVITPTDIPSDMEYVPAGDFKMGSNDEKGSNREKPAHDVYVDDFYIDTYLVTNAKYKEFLDANPQWTKPIKWSLFEKSKKSYINEKYHDGDYLKHWHENTYPDDKADHPVTWVSWYAAMAYAQWIGKRLPTEAEWEKATRGGISDQKYPWGESIDYTIANYNNYIGKTTSVGQYPANGYGIHDMIGNVWEWCLDEYQENFYSISEPKNPICGISTVESIEYSNVDHRKERVLRGGSWLDASQFVRSASRYRNSPTRTLARIGFRCVKMVNS